MRNSNWVLAVTSSKPRYAEEQCRALRSNAPWPTTGWLELECSNVEQYESNTGCCLPQAHSVDIFWKIWIFMLPDVAYPRHTQRTSNSSPYVIIKSWYSTTASSDTRGTQRKSKSKPSCVLHHLENPRCISWYKVLTWSGYVRHNSYCSLAKWAQEIVLLPQCTYSWLGVLCQLVFNFLVHI